MNPVSLLFSFRGRIGRVAFLVGLTVALAIFAAGFYGSFAMLEPAAAILGPRGINAGLIQTGLWIVLILVVLWMVFALFAKRLRDRGRMSLWAPIAILPALSTSIAGGLLTIRPLLDVPALAQNAIYFICAGIGVWILIEAIALPGRD